MVYRVCRVRYEQSENSIIPTESKRVPRLKYWEWLKSGGLVECQNGKCQPHPFPILPCRIPAASHRHPNSNTGLTSE